MFPGKKKFFLKWCTLPDNHKDTFEFNGAEYLFSGPTLKTHMGEFFKSEHGWELQNGSQDERVGRSQQ